MARLYSYIHEIFMIVIDRHLMIYTKYSICIIGSDLFVLYLISEAILNLTQWLLRGLAWM